MDSDSVGHSVDTARDPGGAIVRESVTLAFRTGGDVARRVRLATLAIGPDGVAIPGAQIMS